MSQSVIDIEVNSKQADDSEKYPTTISEDQTSPNTNGFVVKSHHADATLAFMREYDPQIPDIDPVTEKKLAKKIYWIVLLWMVMLNLILFMDKTTLTYSTVLGIFEDTHIDQNQYNNVNTLFYVGYVVGQIPGSYLMQKLPMSKFMSGSIALWTLLTFLMCTVHNYAGLVSIRFFLGVTEAVTVPCMMLSMGMFLSVHELLAVRPIFWASCLAAPIPTGFIAYGCLYAQTSMHPWRVLMIIIGGLAFIMTIVVYLWFPDNPANAKFLTIEERVWVIRRVQASSGSSIEQRVFKKHQFVECIKDPVTWAFGAYFLLQMLGNNLAFQQNLLFKGIGGVDNLGSTLVSVAGGGFALVCCILGTLMLHYIPGYAAWISAFWSLPAFTCSIAIATLPWDDKLGLLACLTMAAHSFGVSYVISFGWASTSCSGYTKKVTRNAISSITYGIGNIVGPQLWQQKDAPRYIPAWIVQILLSFFLAPCIVVGIWFILRKRNKERLAAIEAGTQVHDGIIEIVSTDTENQPADKRVVVNVANLDLTDFENKTFIYPL